MSGARIRKNAERLPVDLSIEYVGKGGAAMAESGRSVKEATGAGMPAGGGKLRWVAGGRL